MKRRLRRGVIGVAIILGSLFFILAFIGLLYYSINFRVKSLVEESLAREEAKLRIVEVTEAYFRPVHNFTGDPEANDINITVRTPMRLHIIYVFMYFNGSVELRYIGDEEYSIVEGIKSFIIKDVQICSGDYRYQLSVKLVTSEGAVIPVPVWVIR